MTLNIGSSTLLCGVFEMTGGAPEPVSACNIRGLPEKMNEEVGDMCAHTTDEKTLDAPRGQEAGQKAALNAMIDCLDAQPETDRVAAFSHRIVHGGRDNAEPVLLDNSVQDHLTKLKPLAPSHQPHNLRTVRRLRDRFPDVHQIGCFDTAFRRTQPRVARLFALPHHLTTTASCVLVFTVCHTSISP